MLGQEGASGTSSPACLEQSSKEGFICASSQIPCSPSETPCLHNKYLNNAVTRDVACFSVRGGTVGDRQQLSLPGEKIPKRTRGTKWLRSPSCSGKGLCFSHCPLYSPSLSALSACALTAAGLKLFVERQPVCCLHDKWSVASNVGLLLL